MAVMRFADNLRLVGRSIFKVGCAIEVKRDVRPNGRSIVASAERVMVCFAESAERVMVCFADNLRLVGRSIFKVGCAIEVKRDVRPNGRSIVASAERVMVCFAESAERVESVCVLDIHLVVCICYFSLCTICVLVYVGILVAPLFLVYSPCCVGKNFYVLEKFCKACRRDKLSFYTTILLVLLFFLFCAGA